MTIKEVQEKITGSKNKIKELRGLKEFTRIVFIREEQGFQDIECPAILKTLIYKKPNGEEEKIENLLSHLKHAIGVSSQDEINKLEEENRTLENKEV